MLHSHIAPGCRTEQDCVNSPAWRVRGRAQSQMSCWFGVVEGTIGVGAVSGAAWTCVNQCIAIWADHMFVSVMLVASLHHCYCRTVMAPAAYLL